VPSLNPISRFGKGSQTWLARLAVLGLCCQLWTTTQRRAWMLAWAYRGLDQDGPFGGDNPIGKITR
jgi:hypothetical protein